MRQFVQFSVVTTMNRNLALEKARSAISRSSGWVTNQTLFSNVAATINFDIPGTSLLTLQENLRAEGLNIHVEKEPAIRDEQDVSGTLSLTFSHDEPDLKRDVPPFG